MQYAILSLWSRLWSRGCRAASRGAAFASAILLCAAVTQAQPAPESVGGEANLKLPDLSSVTFLGIDGHTLLLFGILFCVFGLAFGLTIYTQAEKFARASLHARDFRTDLRNLQNLPDHAGQVPAAAGSFHRRGHRALFRRAAALRSGTRGHYFGVQHGRNCGQLWRGVVRHSREHFCEFADGFRRAARQAVSDLSDSAAKPA